MAQVIMVASGKGGTGKSTVATLLAHELAFKGYKTFLTELDMGLRSIDVISGISEMAVYDIGDVLQGSCSIKKATVTSPYTQNLHIMPAPGKKSGVAFENLKKITDSIYNEYDYIIIDTAAGMGVAVIFVITLASAVAGLMYKYILVPLHIEYLQTICFILVIAALIVTGYFIWKKDLFFAKKMFFYC